MTSIDTKEENNMPSTFRPDQDHDGSSNTYCPDMSTFKTDDPMFLYDIQEDDKQSGNKGGYQFFLFCKGKHGHSVTLIVKDCPVLLEVIIPFGNKNESDVTHLLENNGQDMDDVLSFDFKEKQKYKGFDYTKGNGICMEQVLEINFNNKISMYRARRLLIDRWNVTVVGSDTPSILKFFMTTETKPSSWIRCKNMASNTLNLTTDQAEFVVSYKDIKLEEDILELPKLVVVGFDIETDNPDGICLDGSEAVICISTYVYVDNVREYVYTHYMDNPYIINQEKREQYIRQIEKNKSIPTDAIQPKGKIYSYQDEIQMLHDWKKFVTLEVNADVITGYNVYGYDWQFVFKRMMHLAKSKKMRCPSQIEFEPQEQFDMKRQTFMKDFFSFSKLKNVFTGMIVKTAVSAAGGENKLHSVFAPGRIQVDMLQVIKSHQTQKIVDAKLATVSKHFLGETKEDLKAADLYKIWRTGNKGTIIAYCETDARLPIQLMYHPRLKIILEGVELSKLTVTPLNHILNNGKTKFIKNMTIWYARKNNLVLNIDDDMLRVNDTGSYAGAKVMEPVPGKHDNVLVYDFNSLYPSIMQWGNFCPSTIYTPKGDIDTDAIEKFDITSPITGDVIASNYFAKKSTYEGLLPKMLFFLVTERKKNQRMMAQIKEDCVKNNIDIATTDHAVLNAAQLAKKIIANSVYGVCAYNKYRYGAKEVSETTTSVGRMFIERAKEFIVSNYKHIDAQCVYGDTDSVFISVNTPDMNLLELLELAEEIEGKCKDIFPPGIILGFEKIVKNLILSDVKKRYIGTIYEPNGNYNVPKNYTEDQFNDICKRKFFKSNMSAGFSTKKKGIPPIVTNIIRNIISKLMDNVPEAEVGKYVQDYIENIDKDVKIDDFVAIRRIKDGYKSESVPYQMNVVRKMKHRKMDVPKSGSYVPYVILTPQNAHKLCDLYAKSYYEKYEGACGEDPEYLKELDPKKFEINFEKYIEMIQTEIKRILHVFPKQLYDINNTIMKKVTLLKSQGVYTIFDIFGGNIEDYIPDLKPCRKRKSPIGGQVEIASIDIRGMFSIDKNKAQKVQEE